jgi:hypothetical protein
LIFSAGNGTIGGKSRDHIDIRGRLSATNSKYLGMEVDVEALLSPGAHQNPGGRVAEGKTTYGRMTWRCTH